jgi:hypothetical protein
MSAGYGTVVLSVQWSKGKSRVIPEATERIVARLKRSGMTLFEKVIERGQTQVVFAKVPVGEWVLEAEAWGSGEVVVHAKGVVMAGNQPVSGAQVRLTVGTQTYTATTDGQGKFDLGLVKWFWGGELRVTASGYPEWVGWVGAFDFTRSSEGLVVDMGSGGISRKRQWTQGVVLASGATSFSLGANENKQVEVILASKLTDLHVTPSEIRLGVGSEVEVAVQGKIEQEAGWTPNYVFLILVPLSGGKVNWQIADSSIASLSATSGLSVTVRGLREGQTILTVTDTESGKSKQVRVEVAGRNVTIRLQSWGRPVNAQWAAYQDGDSEWRVLPSNRSDYQFPVTSPNGRYGFAFVVNGQPVVVLQATTDELTNATILYYTEIPRFKVSGRLIGAQGVNVSILIGDMGGWASPDGTYEVRDVPQGTWDLAAVEAEISSELDIAKRIYIHRDLQVNGDTQHDIDFTDLAKTRTLIPNYALQVIGDVDTLSISFMPSKSEGYVDLVWAHSRTSLQFPSIPSDLTRAGDLYVAYASSETEEVVKIFSTPQNITLQLPSPLTGISISGRTISGLRYSGANWWLIWAGSTSVILTNGWLGGSTSYMVPDFRGMPGFPGWQGDITDAFVIAVVANKPVSDILASSAVEWPTFKLDGLEMKTAYAHVSTRGVSKVQIGRQGVKLRRGQRSFIRQTLFAPLLRP